MKNVGKLQEFIRSFCRGDHIVPNFEEIWPSKKGAKERPKRGLEYYYDAMMNGPQLSGTDLRIYRPEK